jgi:hypothetical protein
MVLGRIAIAATALATIGLAAAACANVLGIEDRSLDPLAGGDGGGDGGASCPDPCPMTGGLNHPFAMAADEVNVYWTEFGDDTDTNGSVKSCPVTGCGSSGPTIYAQLQAAPRGIAVDGQNVYWGTQASSATGAIWSCAIGGCSGKPTKVATADTPFGVAVDTTSVYWAEYYLETVNRAPKGGGPAALVWDGGSGTGTPNGAQELALDTGFVYINDQNEEVFRVAIGGGDLVQMYSDPNGPTAGVFGLAVDSKDVYIGTQGGIYQMSKGATSGATVLAPNVTDVVDLKTDPAGGAVYWADFGNVGTDGTVGVAPLDGAAPVPLHQQLVTPEALAVNSTYVFWVSSGTLMSDGVTVASNTGTLYRTAK